MHFQALHNSAHGLECDLGIMKVQVNEKVKSFFMGMYILEMYCANAHGELQGADIHTYMNGFGS